MMEYIFDQVKVKGHDVEFIAKSPQLKEFKEKNII